MCGTRRQRLPVLSEWFEQACCGLGRCTSALARLQFGNQGPRVADPCRFFRLMPHIGSKPSITTGEQADHLIRDASLIVSPATMNVPYPRW
jgi:hypothetical protein